MMTGFALAFALLVVVVVIVTISLWIARTKTFVYCDKRVYMLTASVKTRRVFERLITDINDIVNWCVRYNYPSSREAIRLKTNWQLVDLHETSAATKQIAYVIGKNKSFKLCIDSDENTMRFVVIHELAHMMSASYGHNDEFRRHFVDLLRAAAFLKKYSIQNFQNQAVKYCGMSITSSPCDTGVCGVVQIPTRKTVT